MTRFASTAASMVLTVATASIVLFAATQPALASFPL